MAGLFKQASRAVKSRIRTSEAEGKSQDIFIAFENDIRQAIIESSFEISGTQLDDLISAKTNEANSKYEQYVQNANWKAKEELHAEGENLKNRLVQARVTMHNERYSMLLNEKEQLESTLLSSLEATAVVDMDAPLPDQKDFEEQIASKAVQVKQTFEAFIENKTWPENNPQQLIGCFERAVDSKIVSLKGNFQKACGRRDQLMAEAIESFEKTLCHLTKVKLQETFTEAISHIDTADISCPSAFLENFHRKALKQIDELTKAQIRACQFNIPLPALCSREQFIENLENFTYSKHTCAECSGFTKVI